MPEAAEALFPDEGFETKFIQAGELNFEVLIAGDPTSDRLALCLHGFPEHAYSWRHQIPVLVDLGYRVWAPNQRGYGRTSPRPSAKNAYCLENLLQDVRNLISAADAKSVTLIGHDWGGLIAWAFALRQVAPIDRLIIMNAPHPARFAESMRNDPVQRKRSRYMKFFRLPFLPEFILLRKNAHAIASAFRHQAAHPERFPDNVIEVYRRHAMQPGVAKGMLNWYRANNPARARIVEWPKLETPALLIWGTRDAFLGESLVERMEELAKQIIVRFLDASHWVQQDVPEEVNAILREVLGAETL